MENAYHQAVLYGKKYNKNFYLCMRWDLNPRTIKGAILSRMRLTTSLPMQMLAIRASY